MTAESESESCLQIQRRRPFRRGVAVLTPNTVSINELNALCQGKTTHWITEVVGGVMKMVGETRRGPPPVAPFHSSPLHPFVVPLVRAPSIFQNYKNETFFSTTDFIPYSGYYISPDAMAICQFSHSLSPPRL